MPDPRKLSLSCSLLLVLPLAMGVATDEPPAPAGEAEAVQAAAQSPRTAGAGVDWIDDARLTTLMAQGATRLIEAGRAPEMEAVKAGLATGSCRLDLPREHQKADNPAADADHPPPSPASIRPRSTSRPGPPSRWSAGRSCAGAATTGTSAGPPASSSPRTAPW